MKIDPDVLKWAERDPLLYSTKSNLYPDAEMIYHHQLVIWARHTMLNKEQYAPYLEQDTYKHVKEPYVEWNNYDPPDKTLIFNACSTKSKADNIAARRIIYENPKYRSIRPDLEYYLCTNVPGFSETLKILAKYKPSTKAQYDRALARFTKNAIFRPYHKDPLYENLLCKKDA